MTGPPVRSPQPRVAPLQSRRPPSRVERTEATPRRGTNRAEGRPPTEPKPHGGDVSGDCGRRRDRHSGQSHSRHGAVERQGRSPWSTTAIRHAHGRRARAARRTRSVHGGDRSRRQAVPALGAPRLQNGSPSPSAHAVAETVLAGTPAVVGLKCALHADLLGRNRREPMCGARTDRAAARPCGRTEPSGYSTGAHRGGQPDSRSDRSTSEAPVAGLVASQAQVGR